ncbi:MAG: non-heme iron oxygenase ferredoxin subunit [Elusimicrobia bacterium]|nr:non-heme iron oxygenase ferredoxin subunit [Elusimicrobiota bacterium]
MGETGIERRASVKAAEVPPGHMRIVEAGGIRIAICNVEGVFCAIEDVCSHDDGPLGEGTLRNAEVECPRHGARFDVRTGRATRMPAVAPVRVFPVRTEGGDVIVEVNNGA